MGYGYIPRHQGQETLRARMLVSGWNRVKIILGVFETIARIGKMRRFLLLLTFL